MGGVEDRHRRGTIGRRLNLPSFVGEQTTKTGPRSCIQGSFLRYIRQISRALVCVMLC